MQHEVTIINAEMEIPKFDSKASLLKYLSIVDLENKHETSWEYEYFNGYYRQHFYSVKELLYFLTLEDL